MFQVAMERQYDNRHPRHSEPDTWSHDRWATRSGFDGWSTGSAYGAYNGNLPYSGTLAVRQAEMLSKTDGSSSQNVGWDLCGSLNEPDVTALYG